jgi:phage repressor protein C with HTH and peptisase S24 domain
VRKLLANPDQQPSAKTLKGLSKVLGVSEQYLLTGEGPTDRNMVSSYDPDAPETQSYDGDWDDALPSTAVINGGLHYKSATRGASPEIPAAAGAGQGYVIDDREARVDTGGIATGHPVTSEWLIPPDFVRHGLGATPSQIVLIPVVGHSMEPRLYAGDRVMVDLSQSAYAGDAIYVINDGDDVMKVKTLSKIVGSSPARFRIVSEANPERYDELQHDDFRIIGRVVGRFSRM